jgi:RNA polymerase sigma factor (sigma-70 family)
MLERVARERYPRLVAHGMLLTGSQVEAEDLVQDALVSTFAGRARFGTVEQAEAYVRRAVVSRYIDQGRRRTAERRALVRVAGQPDDALDEMPSGLAPQVEQALGLLSPRERACVVLRHMEDLSVRETAQLLRLSEGAVKRYVSDGVASLNAALGTAVDDDEVVPVRRVSARGARPDERPDERADGRADAGPDGRADGRAKEVRRDA